MKPPPPKTLGGKLLQFRQEAKLTIPELAARADVATGTISNAENDIGDTQLSTLQKITKALGITITINDLDL